MGGAKLEGDQELALGLKEKGVAFGFRPDMKLLNRGAVARNKHVETANAPTKRTAGSKDAPNPPSLRLKSFL